MPSLVYQAPSKLGLVGHTGLVRSVLYSSDSRLLISSSAPTDDDKQPGELRVWDARDGENRLTLKLDGDPFATSVAPDGASLAVALGRGQLGDRSFVVRVLALPMGEVKKEWVLPKGIDVWSLAFSNDGKTLAGGIGGLREGRFFGEVRFWDPTSGEERKILTGHENPVMSLAFSHDGKTLASAGGSYGAPVGEVRLWDVESGELKKTMAVTEEAVVALAFSPNDMTLASGGTVWREGQVFGGSVSLWDVATGLKKTTLPAFPGYVHGVAFSPDGSVLATAGVGPNFDAQIILWDTKTAKSLKTLEPVNKVAQQVTAAKCLAYSPDGKTVAAGGASGSLTIWRVDSR